MSEESTPLWNDPKVWISLFSVILATASFAYSCANQREQDARWEMLNAGSFEFEKADVKTRGTITEEELGKTDFGYAPYIVSDRGTNNYSVIGVLAAYDKTNHRFYSFPRPCFTVSELRKEFADIGRDPTEMEVWREVTFEFLLQNSGKIGLRNCTVRVDLLEADGSYTKVTGDSPRSVNVGAGKHVTFPVTIPAPVTVPLPVEFTFKIHTEFTDALGKRRDWEDIVSWSVPEDGWHYGMPEEDFSDGRPVRERKALQQKP